MPILEWMLSFLATLALCQSAVGCTTNYGLGDPCILPYRFKGNLYFTCTVKFSPPGEVVPMCPIREVDDDTLEASLNVTNWDRCHSDCPYITYNSNEDIREKLASYVQDYPQLADTYDLDTRSVKGESLTVLKITSGANKPRQLLKPMVRLIANMHGNEVTGRELLVELGRYLLKGYKLDRRIRRLVDDLEIHLLPTMNPDGFNRATEGDCDGQDYATGRYNENKIDLNRDFPAWMDKALNKSMESLLKNRQPETQAVARWVASAPWLLSANLHDGAVVAAYPWDHYTNSAQKVGDHNTEDDAIFRQIAEQYADNHGSMRNASACKKYSYLGATTNGAAWYPKNGTLKDFAYLFSPGLEFVLELSCCKFNNDYFLPREWENNRESLLQFLEAATQGVRGLVVDLKGNPVPGVKVNFYKNKSNDVAGKSVESTERGEFWKLLVDGKYWIEAEAGDCGRSGLQPVLVKRDQPVEIKLVIRVKFNCSL